MNRNLMGAPDRKPFAFQHTRRLPYPDVHENGDPASAHRLCKLWDDLMAADDLHPLCAKFGFQPFRHAPPEAIVLS